MNEHQHDAARRAWRGGRSSGTATDVPAMVQQRLHEQRSRKLRFIGSAAIIVPSYIATLVFLPDLRALAIVGLLVAAILAWRVLRAYPAPDGSASAVMTCAEFQLATLTRERNFHRWIAGWGMLALSVGQVAIVAALLTNPRFAKVSAGSLSAFIVLVAGVLAVVFRRSRRTVGELDREIIVLKKGLEA